MFFYTRSHGGATRGDNVTTIAADRRVSRIIIIVVVVVYY